MYMQQLMHVQMTYCLMASSEYLAVCSDNCVVDALFPHSASKLASFRWVSFSMSTLRHQFGQLLHLTANYTNYSNYIRRHARNSHQLPRVRVRLG